VGLLFALDATRQIRLIPKCADDAPKAVAVGFDGYETKPVVTKD
jgi:hypothetical protein